MERYAIDSCVFFDMIPFYDLLKTSGAEKFNNNYTSLKESYNEVKSKIFAIMDNNYIKNSTLGNEHDLIEGYFAYKDQQVEKCLQIISKCNMLKRGIYTTKEGVQKSVKPNSEQIQKANILLDKYNKILSKIEYLFPKFEKIYRAYNLIFHNYSCIELLSRALNNKIELCLVDEVVREINNHTEGKTTRISNDFFQVFPKDIVEDLMRHFSLITYSKKQAFLHIQKLAEEYRSKISCDTKPMHNDRNSMKHFGDSSIMAQASIMGLNLLTYNASDYIFYVSKAEKETAIKEHKILRKNELVRNHIKLVNENNESIATDALPYTPQEYLSGKCNQTIKDSKMMYYFNVKEKSFGEQNKMQG